MKTWFKMSLVSGLAVVGAAGAVNAAGRKARIDIYGAIGGWEVSGSRFLAELREMGPLEEIDLRIHSPGGSVLDGWAIANGLKNHDAKVIGTVEGMAASMASVVLCACDEIIMPKNAYVMIHDVSGGAYGGSDDLRSAADLVDKLQTDIVAFYAERTGLDTDDLIEMMGAETWLNGEDAKAKGFADKIIDEVAVAALAKDISPQALAEKFTNLPDALKAEEEEKEGEDDQSPEGLFAALKAKLGIKSADQKASGLSAQLSGALQNNNTLTARVDTLTVERDKAVALVEKLTADARDIATALVENGFERAEAKDLPAPVSKDEKAKPMNAFEKFKSIKALDERREFYDKNESAILLARQQMDSSK